MGLFVMAVVCASSCVIVVWCELRLGRKGAGDSAQMTAAGKAQPPRAHSAPLGSWPLLWERLGGGGGGGARARRLRQPTSSSA